MTDEATKRQRAREARHLQATLGNPLDAEDEAMLAAIERRGLTLEERRAEVIPGRSILTVP